MTRPLDQAYAMLAQIETKLQDVDADQRAALEQLRTQETELLRQAQEAEASGDQQAIAAVQAELDELRRALAVAQDDTEDDDA